MGAIIVACSACGAKNRIPEKKQHLRPNCGKCGNAVAIGPSAVPVDLTDHDFQQFITSVRLPVMVDFFSPNCGPCQALAPLIRQLASQYLGRVIIAKLDTGMHPGSAAYYQIRGVPTLIFLKGGKVIDQIVGAPPVDTLVKKLDALAG